MNSRGAPEPQGEVLVQSSGKARRLSTALAMCTAADLLPLEAIPPGSRALVGGKALGLARMAQAGLPVPPGFCITTVPFRRLNGRAPQQDLRLCREMADAYDRLGGGSVAVRSSAVDEDEDQVSYAGQYATFLNVEGFAAVADAVGRCWASLSSPRVHSYRKQTRAAAGDTAMAAIVQRMVPADLAGVLFTVDPFDPAGRQALLEVALEPSAVTEGRPLVERLRLGRGDDETACEPAGKATSLLGKAQCAELLALGRRVEALWGRPCDIEWARAAGGFWLLQARPITAPTSVERERVRREEIAYLAARAASHGTAWSRHYLADMPADPTPMSWALLQRLLSPAGGLGRAYQDLGYRSALPEGDHCFELIAGRPFCDLTRELRLSSGGLPLAYDMSSLKRNPRRAADATPKLHLAGAGCAFWLRLPVLLFRLAEAGRRRRQMLRQISREFATAIGPAFQAETQAWAAVDLSQLDSSALAQTFEHWVERTLVDFARHALKPGFFVAGAAATLRQALSARLPPEQVPRWLQLAVSDVRPPPEADVFRALRLFMAGELEETTFTRDFGHRGPAEWELAEARWSDDLSGLRAWTAHAGLRQSTDKQVAPTDRIWEGVAPSFRASARKEAEDLRVLLGLRETARHYLAFGLAQLRRALLELDRRYKLRGGIFFLTPDELPRLPAGADLSDLICQRRRRRAIALTLPMPPVVFSDDLEAIGRPLPDPTHTRAYSGIPVSFGVAEGPAFAPSREPPGPPPGQDFILILPSADLSWLNGMATARGLVFETGGVLSHAALVAREFGIPAVAGIADLHRTLPPGQWLRVDGAAGHVFLLDPPSSQDRGPVATYGADTNGTTADGRL